MRRECQGAPAEGVLQRAPAAQAFPEIGSTDLLDALYGDKRLFWKDGEPALSVGLMSGRDSVRLIPRTRAFLSDGTGKSAEIPAGTPLSFSISEARRARLIYRVVTDEADAASEEAAGARLASLAETAALWKSRGFQAQTVHIGSSFEAAGHLVDTRRTLVALGPFADEAEAQKVANEVSADFHILAPVMSWMEARPGGRIEVRDGSGALLFSADTAVSVRPASEKCAEKAALGGCSETGDFGAWIEAEDIPVEAALGGASRREKRAYRGSLAVAADASGTLALVNFVKVESYLKGIVPSEIFPNAPMEALKAQAVAARNEVLSKLGTRHLGDPYLLCSEQHCQVYAGAGRETLATSRAVEATHGECLTDGAGRVAETAYSASCGGHTEDNNVVWKTPPRAHLRGIPDGQISEPQQTCDLRTASCLHEFLLSPPHAYCAAASLGSKLAFRWEKRFSEEEMDTLMADLGVGHVLRLEFSERGSSGRAAALLIQGTQGESTVRGELAIRRRLKNLRSTMAEVVLLDGKENGWLVRGGGWGHGVGMCQVGAVGRAEAGQSYREILESYFGSTRVEKIYGASSDQR